MRSDDELLSHVRQQAGVRVQRRQRLIGGGVAAVALIVLGLGGVALAGDDGADEQVKTDTTPPSVSSTTTEATTTTTDGPAPTASTTTSSTTEPAPPPETSTTTSTTTTSTTTTTTTAPPPTNPDPVAQTAVGDGILLEVTATQDRDQPGAVELRIRIRADHGSHAGGTVVWDGDADDMFGSWIELGETDCDPLVDDDPETVLQPDPNAGPVDESFVVWRDLGVDDADVTVSVHAATSWCTSDESAVDLTMVVPVA